MDITKEKIRETILDGILELGLTDNIENINDNTHLIDDLSCDSLDMLELVMYIEDELQLQINDNETEDLFTIKSIVEFIEDKLK